MPRVWFWFLSVSLFWTLGAEGFVHPGLLNNQAELNLIRQKVVAGASPWKAAYDQIPSYLNYTPQPVAHFDCSGNNPECSAQAIALLRDAQAAYASALHWIVTGNSAHAEKAEQILDAWSTTLQSIGTAAQNRLEISWKWFPMVNAAEIIKHTYSGWSSAEQDAHETLLRTKIIPRLVTGTSSPRNWETYGALTRMAVAIYLDEQSMFDTAVNDTRSLINNYIFPRCDGPSGMSRETCRLGNNNSSCDGGDIAHTQMGLTGLVQAAEMAKKQGIDLYGHIDPNDGAGLQTSALYHAPFIGWPSRSGSSASTWVCPLDINEQLPSDVRMAWYMAYNHYRDSSLKAVGDYAGPAGNTSQYGIQFDKLTHNYFGQTTPVSLPDIKIFSANPTSVTSGSATTFTVDAGNADSCAINQGVGSVCSSVSACDASPTKSSGNLTTSLTFTLTCTNANGSDTAQVPVTVNPPPGPTINVFSASPPSITAGAASTLTCDATNATSGCTINQGVGSCCADATTCEAGQTKIVSPTATTTYQLSCTNVNGTRTADRTVTVTTPPPPPGIRYVAQTDQGAGDCTSAANACDFAQATTNLGPGSTLRLVGTVTASCDDCLPSGISASQPTVLESATTGSAVLVGTHKISSIPGTATLQSSTATVLSIKPTRQHILVRRLNFTTTGSGANPVIVIGATSSTATAANITLEDLEIQAPTRSGDGACLRSYKTTSAFITAQRLRVHRCGPSVVFSQTAPLYHGVFLQSPDSKLTDSDIWDNQAQGLQWFDTTGTTTINDRAQMLRNRVWGNGGYGFFVGNGTDMVMHQNLSYENGAYGYYVTHPTREILVYGNVAHANSRQVGSNFPGFFANTQMFGVFRNNISIGHPATEYNLLPGTSAVACTDNLSGDASQASPCTGTTLNAIAADVWVDPTNATLANRDYTLKAGSVAIDNGTRGICTSADVTANRCPQALELNTYDGANPDQGAYETDVAVTPTTISRYRLNNNGLDDVGPNDGLATGVAFDATNTIEGSHSALFDAAGDRIEIPLSGFNHQAFTIALSARATAFGGSRPTYLFGHTSDYTGGTYKDRIQIYLTPTGALAIGLGSSHVTIPSAFPFDLNAFKRVVLTAQEGVVSGSGTARVYVAGVLRATASYSGLTQIGPYAHLGNNGANPTEGWLGQIDVAQIANFAWGQTEVNADCAAFCTPSVEPFDPLVLSNCQQALVVATELTCEAEGNPDPGVCNTPADFDVFYDTDPDAEPPAVQQTTTACTLTGAAPALLRLTVASGPSAADTVTLFHGPTSREYLVVNHLSQPPPPPGVLTNCALGSSGLTVTCNVNGVPDQTLCDDVTNFRITDDCVPVTVTHCSLGPSTLNLTRASPPISATVPVALELRDEVQVIQVTNGFVPGTPPQEP